MPVAPVSGMTSLTVFAQTLVRPTERPARLMGRAMAAIGLSLLSPVHTWAQQPAPPAPVETPPLEVTALPRLRLLHDAAAVPAPPAMPGVLGTLTPSFSTAPRAMFRRKGPRGARMQDSRASVWLSANVHDLLPAKAARAWPAPVRLSVGRRVTDGPVGAEYAVGLDLDAARLPGRHPAWMAVKRVLHTVRLPGPAFVLSPQGNRVRALYW